MNTSMKGRVGRTVAAAAVILACATTATAAVGARNGGNPNSSAAAAERPATMAPALAAAPPTPGSELKFVALDPCRILDTRLAGGVVTNATRAFTAAGALVPQGGKSSGCGVPSTAVALQVNVGAISQNTDGFVSGWAFGQAEPNASILNLIHGPGAAIANMVTLPVKTGTGAQFNLKVHGSAHLFADVAGYYVPPLYVNVAPDGSIYQGRASGVVSVTHVSTGRYDILFNRPVTGCAPVASTQTWASNVDASPDGQNGYGSTIKVGLSSTSNAMVDDYFYLSLDC